ncbi:nitroreductase family protein [Brevibacillus ginsengisoli]|uniref:nitroreductase family protein n=1 Tax=Brevibacillus ginsengisoli TaxID=363854 RepID=UPI003CF7659F
MDVIEAIRTRRSIGKVKSDPVDQQVIETLLEAATWAPNHRHTEPWKFFVMTGEGRRKLGEGYAAVTRDEMDDPTSEENQKRLEKEVEKAFRAPLVITVAVVPSDHPDVLLLEERAAVNAAIQNMLLAAHALGLGAIWRTGKPAYHPIMKQQFGLRDQDEILGFIYIGYPDMPSPKGKRKAYTEKTVWINE